ncbi:MAG: amidohydrolase [Acidimicrobiales bacterium]|nr:amidohydrolase [Acidimicrobiales bacterium]
MTESQAGPAWAFDADGHVVEPPDIWDRYLPERFRSGAPALSRPISAGTLDTHLWRIAGGTDPARRLPDMDLDGIEQAALFPTLGLMIQGVTASDMAVALCRAINDWLADYCSYAPGRLRGVGALPMTGPDEAVDEARRCIEELGFRAVFRRPESYPGVMAVHDARLDDLWTYLEATNVPIMIHAGQNRYVPSEYFTNRFPDYFVAAHANSFVVEATLSLTSFTLYGILERHPGLRVGLVECGATWALAHTHRLDEHTKQWDGTGAHALQAELSMLPSEYFRRQCFVSVEETEPGLAAMLERFPGSIVFASDYPHGDGTFPGSTTAVMEAPELTADQRRAILRDNACRLYQ